MTPEAEAFAERLQGVHPSCRAAYTLGTLSTYLDPPGPDTFAPDEALAAMMRIYTAYREALSGPP